MNSTWNIVAIAVLAALVGGVGGASLMNSRATADINPAAASSLSTTPAPPALTKEQIDQVARVAARTAIETVRDTEVARSESAPRASSTRSGRAPRRVYYDYAAPSGGQTAAYAPAKRSFWSRHRDILTVGIGTAIGTAIGAGTGGKKGALIGACVGARGSALYTYGLRNRSNSYNR